MYVRVGLNRYWSCWSEVLLQSHHAAVEQQQSQYQQHRVQGTDQHGFLKHGVTEDEVNQLLSGQLKFALGILFHHPAA